jgi:hypothetical protein
MDILFVTTISILSVEYFFYLPVANLGKGLLKIMKNSLRVLNSGRISDHWKEIVLIRYAMDILKTTVYLLLILLGFLLLIIVGSLFFDGLVGKEATSEDVLSKPRNWIFMTFIASIYLYFRNRYVKS